jgi:hypothetical protein
MKCSCGKPYPDGAGSCPYCHEQTPIKEILAGHALVVGLGLGYQNPVYVQPINHAIQLVKMGYTNVLKLGDLISICSDGIKIYPKGGHP